MPPTAVDRIARGLSAGLSAKRLWKAVLLLLLVGVAVLALMSKPPSDAGFGWDKLNHALAFTALGFSAYLGYPSARDTRVVRLCLLLIAFGALIEVLQHYVPGRSSEWGDLLADSIGAVGGAVAAASALEASVRRSS
ncbi:MAG: VanZ family protein [Burkholderiaceae bacterium]